MAAVVALSNARLHEINAQQSNKMIQANWQGLRESANDVRKGFDSLRVMIMGEEDEDSGPEDVAPVEPPVGADPTNVLSNRGSNPQEDIDIAPEQESTEDETLDSSKAAPKPTFAFATGAEGADDSVATRLFVGNNGGESKSNPSQAKQVLFAAAARPSSAFSFSSPSTSTTNGTNGEELEATSAPGIASSMFAFGRNNVGCDNTIQDPVQPTFAFG